MLRSYLLPRYFPRLPFVTSIHLYTYRSIHIQTRIWYIIIVLFQAFRTHILGVLSHFGGISPQIIAPKRKQRTKTHAKDPQKALNRSRQTSSTHHL